MKSRLEVINALKDTNNSNDIFYSLISSSLRLSYTGMVALRKILKSYRVEITSNYEQIPTKHFLFLQKYCEHPYYIGKKFIIFFDEEEAFLFKMCDGDIDLVDTVSQE